MPFYSLSSSGGLVEAATFAALPATGATGTLYVVTGTNTLYRWSGSAYVEVSASPAEVVEAANLAAFPATGAAGKIYVALDTGKTYRWSGSAYAEISAGDWATLTNKPSAFAPSAHAASHASGGSDAVTLAVSQVTGLQTALDGKADSSDSRLSDARTPTSHAASHASSGSDPITVGTVSGRIVTTTTGGKLSTASSIQTTQVLNETGVSLSSLNQFVADVASYGLGSTVAAAVGGNGIAPSGAVVSPSTLPAGSNPGDLVPLSVYYNAGTVFQVNALGDVSADGTVLASAFSGALDATNLTGTIAAARLPASAREAAESFIHPFLFGGL